MVIKMIKGIIFDMDGLMINSEEVTFDGYVISLKKRGHTITRDFYVTTLGKNAKSLKIMYEDKYPNIDFDEVLREVHEYMANLFEIQGVPLKPGLIQLLSYLKQHNYKIVVATSSARSRVERIFYLAKISQYFDGIVCGDEVSKGKPDPEIFLKALDKTGLDKDKVVILEDSEAGIQAAYRGNIPVICIPDMKYPSKEYEDMTIATLDSLEKVQGLLQSYDLNIL